ncbi:hypothetical protein SAMN04487909_12724 [Aneurinibacillus migulanus]|uniref:Uncharacterized protein n=1 Tax=Aneurinibacillus migulanus TaxID=47500 RepID=A0A1G8W7X0_ANEMI|nr:hypothetical protein SAMN04487909_12724 [Aneurinibacillus migulanus]
MKKERNCDRKIGTITVTIAGIGMFLSTLDSGIINIDYIPDDSRNRCCHVTS